MKEMIAALLFYMGQHGIDAGGLIQVDTDDENSPFYMVTNHRPPPVQYVNRQQLVLIAYEGNVPAGFDYAANSTLGLYNHKNNTIYLHESVDLTTVFGKSVLLHELVHFNQYAMGEYARAECMQANERLAYQMQNQYLQDNGLAELYNQQHIIWASFCPGSV